METGQDDRKVPQSSTRQMTVGTGRRIIGEVAGHEINLEIEGVQDKIKNFRNLNFKNWTIFGLFICKINVSYL